MSQNAFFLAYILCCRTSYMMLWFRILHPIKGHIDSKIVDMWWLYLMGDQRAGVFGSLLQGPSSCSGCSLLFAEQTMSNFHFMSAAAIKKCFWQLESRPGWPGQTCSPHTCPSVRCCSGWVRERLCLFWRRLESCSIPASSPTLCKEQLHRCSPKVNGAPWFCSSSVFWNEALSGIRY